MGDRAASVLGDPPRSQPAASVITEPQLFTPAGKGKKKGFRAVTFFLWLLFFFSFSRICRPQTFIYESKIVAYSSSRSELSPGKQDNARKRTVPSLPQCAHFHAQGKVIKPLAPDAQVGSTKAEAGSEASGEAAARPGPHCSRVRARKPKGICYPRKCDSHVFVVNRQVFLSYSFEFDIAIIIMCFHQRETNHSPF